MQQFSTSGPLQKLPQVVKNFNIGRVSVVALATREVRTLSMNCCRNVGIYHQDDRRGLWKAINEFKTRAKLKDNLDLTHRNGEIAYSWPRKRLTVTRIARFARPRIPGQRKSDAADH